MSLAQHLRNKQGYEIVPINKATVARLGAEVRKYAVFCGQHTHILCSDASVSRIGETGLGLICYDIFTESVEIVAVRLRGNFTSVQAELIGIEILVNFLPKSSTPFIYFDQKYIIDYFLKRKRKPKKPRADIKPEYVKTAAIIDGKFTKFNLWWSASKEGEVIHSIADAVASLGSSWIVKDHRKQQKMSLDMWSKSYAFQASNNDYDAFLALNSPLMYRKQEKELRRVRKRKGRKNEENRHSKGISLHRNEEEECAGGMRSSRMSDQTFSQPLRTETRGRGLSWRCKARPLIPQR